VTKSVEGARSAPRDTRIILFTETWLNSKFENSLFFTTYPYHIIRADRTTNKGGGICIFISQSLPYQIIDTPKISNSNILAIDIVDPSTLEKQRLIVVYRPTTSETNNQFQNFIDALSDLCNVNHSILLAGDFNFSNIAWCNKKHSSSNALSTKEQIFVQFVESFDLLQHINFPTRAENIIDLIFSTKNHSISNLTCLPPFGYNDNVSDHNAIKFNFQFFVPNEPVCVPTYDFFNANYELIKNLLCNIDWTLLFL
jgi:hypothetical protein